jgi:hypothetical protein
MIIQVGRLTTRNPVVTMNRMGALPYFVPHCSAKFWKEPP